jgi:Ca2+-binding EF-hand superfamily protein
LKGNSDGAVSYQEWVDYYTDLSISIPSDEYFVAMMESTWCLAEDEQSGVFQDKVRQLIGMMRQRLLSLSNRTEEEFKLRIIFKGFDLNNSGDITVDELGAMLAKLGISVERKYIQAMMQ